MIPLRPFLATLAAALAVSLGIGALAGYRYALTAVEDCHALTADALRALDHANHMIDALEQSGAIPAPAPAEAETEEDES